MSRIDAREVQRRRLRDVATTPGQSAPQLMEAAELERIRSAARAGLHEPTVLRLLEQLEIRDGVIHAIARRAAESDVPERQEAARAAEEAIAEHPPIHVRLEFDVPTEHVGAGSVETFLAGIRDWTVAELATLADVAQATVTYRGSSESWETRLP